MKRFISIFMMCMIFGYLVLFTAFSFLYENLWLAYVLIPLAAAGIITYTLNQADRMGELEKRVTELEGRLTSEEKQKS